MTAIPLSKLLKTSGDLYRITQEFLTGLGLADRLAILDVNEVVLLGTAPVSEEKRFPIRLEDQLIGWVSGDEQPAKVIANWIRFSAEREAQKKSMAAELIDRYRELNLLYHLSEHLASSPDIVSVGKVSLEEAVRIIPSATGMILLKNPSGNTLQKVATWGFELQVAATCCLIDNVLETGRAELANSVSGTDYFIERKDQLISLACAPLKTEKSILGVILLTDSRERTFSAGELKLLNAIGMQIAPALEISRLWQVAIEKAQMEREVQMARRVQESLLPMSMPSIPGWSFANRWRPVRNVSGDFYDLIAEDKQNLGFVIADVTDKGLPAALFMVFVRSAIRSSVNHSGSLAAEISRANHLICQDSREGLFATMFYARLHTDTGELNYVNAGHNPPVHYRSREGALDLLTRTGVPLGMDARMSYNFRTINLEPGDFIVFYTDGVTEAINSERDEFGLERLKDVIQRLRNCSVEQILDGIEQALLEFTRPVPVFDDVTLMVIRRTEN